MAKPVPMPGGYSIDSTEVTNRQYFQWVSTTPSTSGQPSLCNWNSEFDPNTNYFLQEPDHPVVRVDWCDAYAYCRAVGKRLCGAIGGGPVDFYDFDDPAKSQWQAACSSGGLNSFPYGPNYEEQSCNGWDNNETGCAGPLSACSGACACTTAEVGSLPNCQSPMTGYEGVYDLSGNVAEWEDSCKTATLECRVRGNDFGANAAGLYCGTGGLSGSNGSGKYAKTGFRCCSDP